MMKSKTRPNDKLLHYGKRIDGGLCLACLRSGDWADNVEEFIRLEDFLKELERIQNDLPKV